MDIDKRQEGLVSVSFSTACVLWLSGSKVKCFYDREWYTYEVEDKGELTEVFEDEIGSGPSRGEMLYGKWFA
jgi:hypothetical protein